MFMGNNAIFRILLFISMIFSVFVTNNTLANNNNEAGRHTTWHSGNAQFSVWVSILKTNVNVTVWSDVPAVTLQKVNSHLWNTYGKQYVLINDFNRDGQLDIGIMEGAGVAGSDKCYAVYEYVPAHFSYRNTSSMMVCR
jgi:hypothetical protein